MTFNPSRIGRAIGITVGAVAALAGVGAVAALRRPLPRTSGRVSLPGLRAAVEIRRDRWGIPHIYAEHNEDLFCALGYVHAQDRLWQMELHRRIGHGRLAEIVGSVAIDSDRFIRTLGFSRIAHREVALLDDETATLMSAYIRGVNACIEQVSHRLPLEFTILGFQPQPWELADLLVWPKMMALNLSTNWMQELLQAQIVAVVGAERAVTLRPRYPEDGPLTVPAEAHYTPDLGTGALQLAGDASLFTGETETPQGSNAWVVSGTRTTSGRPLLANDPHLNVAIPNLWYHVHLEGGDFHVAGATIPATCGVVIGHNQRIAWGITNARTDNQDLFIEQFDPADPRQYRWRDEWRTADVVQETIKVKGQTEPVVIDVRITHHGPIIDPVAGELHSQSTDESAQTALALRWTALDPSPTLTRAVLKLNRARNWTEFRAALTDWDTPPQNFVYADIDGHIGYCLAGRLPLRRQGDGMLPVPGWNGEYEWEGMIPFDELPSQLDPANGTIVSANHRIAPSTSRNAPIQGFWLNPYRAQRIQALLDETKQHDVRSFARIQNDVLSLPGKALVEQVARLQLEPSIEQRVRDLFVTWDGQLRADSIGGAIYDELRYRLLRIVYQEVANLFKRPAALGSFSVLPANLYLECALPMILARMAERPLDQVDDWLGGGRSWGGVLRAALSQAIAELSARLGPDPTRWQYGRFHTLTLRHPLGSVPALTPLFNRGPWPMGGDIDTVNHCYIPRDIAGMTIYNAPSLRFIFDLSDWDNARAILPAGQSGHPASSHYADMTDAWRAGAYHPLVWSRAAVERYTDDVLVLTAEG
ncbi:MAG: peptidase S45 [Chloroflexus sp.]|uniref:penicillin acylase family protein n=1 Tax=Chloroflexus sp. TaxID=1904827 RepID=UPI0021DDDD3A|nr:penicillin acylase family protein [Chloroflexus sp.]GIV87729.1 MAG: peptidase S45 [Chloroflexus sp.]